MLRKKNKFAIWFLVFLLVCQMAVPVYATIPDSSGQSNGAVDENTTTVYDATAKSTNELDAAKENAINWLLHQVDEEKLKKEDGLINPYCDAIAVLRIENMVSDTLYSIGQETKSGQWNTDEMAHLVWGRKDASILTELWKGQKEDGGFGLTADYESDPYDTLLVLLAECYMRNCAVDPEVNTEQRDKEVIAALDYMSENHNRDGGTGYTATDMSRPGLTAEYGILIQKLGIESMEEEAERQTYCQSSFTEDFSESNFQEQAEIARYLYQTESIRDPEIVQEKLLELPLGNGSIYDSIDDTVQFILLVNAIREYHALKVDTLETTADHYVLEAGTTDIVKLTSSVRYRTGQDTDAILRYTVYENGEAVVSDEEPCHISKDDTSITVETDIQIEVKGDSAYQQTVELFVRKMDQETILAETQYDYNVHMLEEKELVLNAEAAEDSVRLEWTDINTEDDRYGYRIFRSKENGDWETRSAWNGEKVRVLNIYPNTSAKNYLTEWMNKTLIDTEKPAGMGLFDIDTVYIGDYNKDAERYLMDEKGNYQYDVLMFGTSDSNSNMDLSDTGFQATQDFIDSGRGVLFGHDTVVYWMKNFSKFAEQLGCKMHNGYTRRDTNKVAVVKKGFLTNYPWKLEGILTIPTTHTQAQYTGGTLPAEVWMELQTGYDTDEETGATTSAYLFTNNQLAMIQTGHSNGQATDDERKVIANTLFYLKQLTDTTSSEDHSFYDEAAPTIIGVTDRNADDSVEIRAEDEGTHYRYYVEALNEAARSVSVDDTEKRIVESNIVGAEARSGIRGFLIYADRSGETDTEYPLKDENGNILSEIYPATEGNYRYSLPDMEPGEKLYLHIYAVDRAGNISEEIVKEIKTGEKPVEHLVTDRPYLDLPYALISTEGNVTISCNDTDIAKDIYAEQQFVFQGTSLNVDGKIASRGDIIKMGYQINVAEEERGCEQLLLPDYTEMIRADMADCCEELEKWETNDGFERNIPTIVKGTSEACGDRIAVYVNFMSDKNISWNAHETCIGEENKAVLCSVNGDIHIQTDQFYGNGMIYAPNGKVTIQADHFDYRGTIIARSIEIQTGSYYQNQ